MSTSLRRSNRAHLRRALIPLVTAVLLVGTVGLVASGALTSPSATTTVTQPTCTTSGCVRLHLGSDGRYFSYNGTVQNLTTQSNNCKITSPTGGSIMQLESTSSGSQTAPGMNGTDIGVRSNSSGNGTPCGQVDTTETLTLSPSTTGVVSGKSFYGLTMDLEMTGNAVVKLTLNTSPAQTYYLQTGTSITVTPQDTTAPYLVMSGPGDFTESCAAAQSSGPNSNINDNCEWTVLPGAAFTSYTLTTVTNGSVSNSGTVSLEGSNDFGNDTTYDTQMYVAQAPTAVNDAYGVNQAQTLSTTAANGVLANDSDPAGNTPLTAVLATQPSNGTLTFNSDGSFTYAPNATFHGTDTFTYQAKNTLGVLSSAATVTITVNGAPVAVDDSYTANSGQQLEAGKTSGEPNGVLSNDTDVDGPAPLSVAGATPLNLTTANGGSVTLYSDGSFDYTSQSGFTGTDTFTYQAQDAAGAVSQNSATASINVLPLICGGTPVTFGSNGLTGSFTLLAPSDTCKGYSASTDSTADSVTFIPNGTGTQQFRGFVTLAPDASASGQVTSTLNYDPTGNGNIRPVPWCTNTTFDSSGNITNATIPNYPTDTWCIASANTIDNGNGTTTTTWQVFGQDDPVWYK